MTIRVVQKGSGEPRPLVVLYHATGETDDLIRAAVASRVAVVNITLPPFVGNYRSHTPQNPAWAALSAKLEPELGAGALWPVIWSGFSEGCQALRTHLIAKPWCPQALIAVDGIHASFVPVAQQVAPWRQAFRAAGAELGAAGLNAPLADDKPIAVATCSSIVPPSYLGTRKSLEHITSWQLEPGDAPSTFPVQLGARVVNVSVAQPALYGSGNLSVLSFQGGDARAHSGQLLVVLPSVLAQVADALGCGPTNDVGSDAQGDVWLSSRSCPLPEAEPSTLRRLLPLGISTAVAAATAAMLPKRR